MSASPYFAEGERKDIYQGVCPHDRCTCAKKCSGVTKSIAKSDVQGIPDGEALSQGVTKGVTRGVTIVQKDSRTDPTDPTDSTDMARKENIENPTLMTQAYGLKCYTSTIVPESKLSHIVQAHHDLVPKPQSSLVEKQ